LQRAFTRLRDEVTAAELNASTADVVGVFGHPSPSFLPKPSAALRRRLAAEASLVCRLAEQALSERTRRQSDTTSEAADPLFRLKQAPAAFLAARSTDDLGRVLTELEQWFVTFCASLRSAHAGQT
jgi:hypothetical protein